MRTIRTKVYKFNELSEQAKEVAINNYRNNSDYNYIYSEEVTSSVKAVIELFNLKTGRTYDDIRTGHIDAEYLELKGVRLYKYLVNNFYNDLFKPKYIKSINRKLTGKQFIFKVAKDYKGEEYTQIYSKNFKDNSGILTGMMYDNEILQPVYDFLKKIESSTSLEDIYRDIEGAISKAYNDVEKWVNSEDFISEEIEANEYEFTREGKMI